MTLTAENLINTIHQIISNLKQDIYQRFYYNLDENLAFLDLTRNLILLENVYSEESIKRSQEQQRRLFNHQHHISTNSLLNRSYNTRNYSDPFNIQNQEELFINQSYSHQPYNQQQNYDLDSSKDSIPQYHKQLLKEYKNSMEQLQKQNKIIRSIVKENSQSFSQHKYSKDNFDRDYPIKENKQNTFETNYANQSITDDYKVKTHSKNHKSFNRSKEGVYDQRQTQKQRSSVKRRFNHAEKELEELQYMREKEIQKIKQIEKAIRRREEVATPQNMSSSEVEQYENIKSQKKVNDKQYIFKINNQISKLDKEIRSITQYIQDCILRDQ